MCENTHIKLMPRKLGWIYPVCGVGVAPWVLECLCVKIEKREAELKTKLSGGD